MAKAKTTKKSEKKANVVVATVRCSNLIEKIYAERAEHSNAIRRIDKQIQDAEKEQRLKRLAGYVGKYFEETDYANDYYNVYYVVGISKDTLRNRVFQVTENGKDDPWYTFEEHDALDMGEKRACTKANFDRIIHKIRKRIEGYCRLTEKHNDVANTLHRIE